jgi:hypothetical protein
MPALWFPCKKDEFVFGDCRLREHCDALARRIAQSAGLTVWGTLRVLLEGKKLGFASEIAPLGDKLESSGMWISRRHPPPHPHLG